MSLNIVICEDEPIHRDILRGYLIDIFESKNFEYKIFEFKSGEDLLKYYPSKVDLIFLDIQMGKMNGMDTARKIREFDIKCDIVFTTSLSDYMQEGYEVRACRYLLKPINYDDLLSFINSISENNPNFIIVSQVGYEGNVKVYIDEILYIETINRCAVIYTHDKTYTTRVKLESFEKELYSNDFYRCHRCYLVNLKKASITKNNMIHINAKEIPISRRKIKDFKLRLTDVLGEVLC
jgi:DNA-binding LytR/AlgR family response regulator